MNRLGLALVIALAHGCAQSHTRLDPTAARHPSRDSGAQAAPSATGQEQTAPADNHDDVPCTSGACSGDAGGSGAASTALDAGADSPPCAAPLPSGVCLTSDAFGVWPAQHVVVDQSSAITISLTAVPGFDVFVKFGDGGPFNDTLMDFVPPAGQIWKVGSYGPDEVAISGLGTQGFADSQWCDYSTSRFAVSELEFTNDGHVGRFAATFEQHCHWTSATLRGSINFYAHGKPDAPREPPEDCTLTEPTGFCITGSVGDGISLGAQYRFGASDRTFGVMSSAQTLLMQIAGAVPWTLTFRAGTAHGGILEVGSYDVAGGSDTSADFMDISSFDADCATHIGHFDVRELERDENGAITKAAIDFVHRCDSADAAALYGKARISSTLQ